MKNLGIILIIIGVIILTFIFGPVIKEEITYQSDKIIGIQYSLDADPNFPQSNQRKITPKDTDFGLVIPKINVNEKIYSQIDPIDPAIYLPVLQKGVAQSLGSPYPNFPEGNVFLFAHSTDAFYNVTKYNASFYLLGKLKNGDEIDIYYRNNRYKYFVYAKGVVSPEQLETYVASQVGGRTVTLQTCYPPGTTLKRLIVIAKRD